MLNMVTKLLKSEYGWIDLCLIGSFWGLPTPSAGLGACVLFATAKIVFICYFAFLFVLFAAACWHFMQPVSDDRHLQGPSPGPELDTALREAAVRKERGEPVKTWRRKSE